MDSSVTGSTKERIDMEQVIVTYGKGDGKKGSVRMKPLKVESKDNAVTLESQGLGDYYVSRDIMKALGLSDDESVKVTIERA